MDEQRIKSTFYIKGAYLDHIDKRSEEGLVYKYEILESDLDAYWGILARGMDNVREILSEAELKLIIKVIRGKHIVGQDILMWAGSLLVESVRYAFRSYSKWESIGIMEDELLGKLKSLDMLERIALCDWAQKQWIKHAK